MTFRPIALHVALAGSAQEKVPARLRVAGAQIPVTRDIRAIDIAGADRHTIDRHVAAP